MTNAGHTGTPIADESGETLSPKWESLRQLWKWALALATIKALWGVALDVLSISSAQAATPDTITQADLADVSARFPKIMQCYSDAEKTKVAGKLNKLLKDPDTRKLGYLDGAIDLIVTSCSPKEELPSTLVIFIDFLNNSRPRANTLATIVSKAPWVKDYFVRIAGLWKIEKRENIDNAFSDWANTLWRQLSQANG